MPVPALRRALCPFLLAGLLLAPAWSAGADTLPSRELAVRTVELTFPADGVVEAVQQATVAAQVAGRIVEMRVDAGQRVRRGEVLARIDAREAGEAEAAARSQLATAQAALERTQALVRQKFLSQAALDKARAERDAAQAAAAQASVGLGHATVTAPISGVVAVRHAELGEMAAPGRPLITVHDPAGLRVTASVPQFRLSALGASPRAEVEFPEFGRRVAARSVTLLPVADAATHVSQARLSLPEGEALPPLRPGQYVRVHFVSGQADKLTVPASAVARRGEVTALYVAAGDGPPVLRQVRLGEPVAGGEVEVLAGVRAGERVLLDPVAAALALKAAVSRRAP